MCCCFFFLAGISWSPPAHSSKLCCVERTSEGRAVRLLWDPEPPAGPGAGGSVRTRRREGMAGADPAAGMSHLSPCLKTPSALGLSLPSMMAWPPRGAGARFCLLPALVSPSDQCTFLIVTAAAAAAQRCRGACVRRERAGCGELIFLEHRPGRLHTPRRILRRLAVGVRPARNIWMENSV